MIDLNNKVIKCLTPEHGKRILQFFSDNGVDTSNYAGTACAGKFDDCYYGIVNGHFSNYSPLICDQANAEVIELPEPKPVLTFPRKMYVWDDFVKPEITYVINIVDNKVYAVFPSNRNIDYFDKEFNVSVTIYQHACELDELDKVYSNPSTTSVDEQLSDIQVLRCEIEAISRKIDVVLNTLTQ